MQRTIYDFLYHKYDFLNKGTNPTFRHQFQANMKVYWGLKLLAVTFYLAIFLKFVGRDTFLPNDTYWFVACVTLLLIVITLAYFNVVTAWFVLTLSKHRKWLDNLLMIAGGLLCISIYLPTYTFGDSTFDLQSLNDNLFIPGLFMFTIGMYRKIHYQKSGAVVRSALFSILVTAGILFLFPIHSIGKSLYLGFILLVNAGFLADMIVYYYLHNKSKANYR
ncbi:hypothetical protein NV379_18505 [Paenibacillus sp. N1-5-1-14]|uniref:hypothetical protein n=1 Tax=Paenibacillus radicibacter TaxID=2972488 RepID=UPI002158A47C|nr:hypothetical protein [Paenibacillus radicibacter]MCR8644648.1 hypothetical protein [Paenibacillus radicibacter]